MSQVIEFEYDKRDPKHQLMKERLQDRMKKYFNIENINHILEYVLTFIGSKKTKPEILKDFQELFDDHTEEIVNWLIDYINKNFPPRPSQEDNKDLVEEIIQEKSDSHRIGSQIVNPHKDHKDDKRKNIFNSAIENIRDDKKKGRKESDSRTEHSVDEGARTVKIGDKSIVIKRKVKRERSREKEPEREREHVREYNNNNNGGGYKGRYDNRFNNNNKFDRNQRDFYNKRGRGRGNKFGNYSSQRKNYDNQQHYQQKEHKKYEEFKSEAPNTNEKVPSEEKSQKEIPKDPANSTDDQNPNNQNSQRKKIRCKNWPNCKKGDQCEYHHPTETCQFFPKCTFGNQCLFIHPNIACKYGFYCTRIGCSYTHSFGYNQTPFPPFMPGYPAPHFKNMKLDKREGSFPGSNESKQAGEDGSVSEFSQNVPTRPHFQHKQYFPGRKEQTSNVPETEAKPEQGVSGVDVEMN